MIAISKSPLQSANTQHDGQFLQMIPAIERYARSAFRNLRPQTREEAICAVVADAFFAFRRLVELGKQDVAYATPLARFAVRRYWSGRCASMPRSDIMSQFAPTAHGIVVERLDMFDEHTQHWHQALVEDRRATPADTAAADRRSELVPVALPAEPPNCRDPGGGQHDQRNGSKIPSLPGTG